jgi:hypothetical protein
MRTSYFSIQDFVEIGVGIVMSARNVLIIFVTLYIAN